MGSAGLKAENVRYAIKAQWQHYHYLEANNDKDACQKLLCSILVLNPAEEARNHQHSTSLDRKTQCQKERSQHWLVHCNHPKRNNNIKCQKGIIKQICIEFTYFFISQEQEADQLSFPNSVFEVHVSYLSDIVLDC